MANRSTLTIFFILIMRHVESTPRNTTRSKGDRILASLVSNIEKEADKHNHINDIPRPKIEPTNDYYYPSYGSDEDLSITFPDYPTHKFNNDLSEGKARFLQSTCILI